MVRVHPGVLFPAILFQAMEDWCMAMALMMTTKDL